MGQFDDMEKFLNWIEKHPEKYTLLKKIICDMGDRRPEKIGKIIIHQNLFPFRGVFMGIYMEPTTYRIVDIDGKDHAVIFILEPRR